MSGMHGSRRHQRVRRKSHYDDWLLDAFDGDFVAYWPLTEPAGVTSFTDRASAHDAAISGTIALQQGSLVGGVQGSARFDGSTVTAAASDAAALDIGSSDSMTVLAWMRIDGASSFSSIVAKRDSNGVGYNFLLRDDGTLQVFIDDGTDTVRVRSGSLAVGDGKPHLAAWQIDRSGDTARTFVDGVQDDSGGISSIDDTSNSDELDIGGEDGSGDYPGTLQHVALLSSVLTASELTHIYAQGAGFFDRGRLL